MFSDYVKRCIHGIKRLSSIQKLSTNTSLLQTNPNAANLCTFVSFSNYETYFEWFNERWWALTRMLFIIWNFFFSFQFQTVSCIDKVQHHIPNTLKHTNWNHKMESYLVNVKQLRIPRPKFATIGGNTSCGAQSRMRGGPREPPKDYNLDDDYSSSNSNRKLQTETEELRQAIQEKL